MAFDLLCQRAPAEPTREQCVELLLGAAKALQAGEPVAPTAGALLGTALLEFLLHGGDLGRRLGVHRRGSHRTVQHLARMVLAIEPATGEPRPGDIFTLPISSSTDDDGDDATVK
jgi:hypothetical protein